MGAAAEQQGDFEMRTADPNQVWFTTREAAHYLRMSAMALQKQVERGYIRPATTADKGRRFGHRFRRETLDAFIQGERSHGGQG